MVLCVLTIDSLVLPAAQMIRCLTIFSAKNGLLMDMLQQIAGQFPIF